MLLNAASLNADALNASGSINYTIAVDDLLHVHSLDATTTIEHGTILVDDLLHAHDLAATGLTQDHVISVADLTHVHIIDGSVVVGPITDLSDDFEDGAIHPKWVIDESGGGTITETGGELVFDLPGLSYANFSSANTYNGTSAALVLETDVVPPPADVSASLTITDLATFSYAGISPNTSGMLRMEFWDEVAGDYDALILVPFDAIAMRLMRFRHDPVSGLIHAETSPNGVDWTVRGSSATAYLDVSQLSISIAAFSSTPDQTIAFNQFLITIEAVLESSGLVHAHSVDAAGFVYNYIIIPADLLHAHSEDAVGLTVGYVLVPAELTHVQLVDGATLVQGHFLVPSDLTHAVTFDATLVVLPQIGDVRGILVVAGGGRNRVTGVIGNTVASTQGRLKVA